MFAEPITELREQRQRIVVVDEAHRFPVAQRAERAEDRRVAEAACNTARIEDMDVFFWNQRIGHGELRASAGAAMLRREVRAAPDLGQAGRLRTDTRRARSQLRRPLKTPAAGVS